MVIDCMSGGPGALLQSISGSFSYLFIASSSHSEPNFNTNLTQGSLRGKTRLCQICVKFGPPFCLQKGLSRHQKCFSRLVALFSWIAFELFVSVVLGYI